MASNTALCGVCYFRQISKPSEVWCSECDEGLCVECKEHHAASKISRHHNIIPISEYQKLPSYILDIEQFCSKHNEKHQMYCKNHDSPCCRTCVIEDHKQCQDIAKIEDVVKNVKSSSAFYDIEQTMTEVLENIRRIKEDRQMNLKTFSENRKQIEKEVHEIRLKINQHLDNIQDDLLRELHEREKNESQKIRELLDSLEQNENEVVEFQTNLANVKQHASDLQAYLAMKQMENDVEKTNKYVNSLSETDSLYQKVINWKTNPSLDSIVSTIKNLGEIRIEKKPSLFFMVHQKDIQAQTMVTTSVLESITLQVQQHVLIAENDITGCCLLPDGRMAFSGYKSRTVRILNLIGMEVFSKQIDSWCYDLTYITDKNSIAVTSGMSKRMNIEMIDLTTKMVGKRILVGSHIHGIRHDNKLLVFCAVEKGLCQLDLSNESISTVREIQMSTDAYVTTFSDNIYYTNNAENTVTCCDFQGTLKWTFKNEDVLRHPMGISVDNSGNIYVVGLNSNNVVVISNDGKRSRQLLTRDDGLNNPRVLHYEGSRKQLLVVHCTNKAILYNVIYM